MLKLNKIYDILSAIYNKWIIDFLIFCSKNAMWFPLCVDIPFIFYILWTLCKYFPYCLQGIRILESISNILPHMIFVYKELFKYRKLIYKFFYNLIFKWKYVIYAYYWSKGFEWIIFDFLLILFFIYPVFWILRLLLIVYWGLLSWLFLILDILILDIICNVWIFVIFRKLYRIFRKTIFFFFYDYWRYIVYYRILRKWDIFIWKCRYRYTSEQFFKWVHRIIVIKSLDWFEDRVVRPFFRVIQFRNYFVGRWLYSFILHPYFVTEEYVLRLWRFIKRFPRLCVWYTVRFIKRIPVRIRFLWKMRNLDYRKGFYRRSFINFLVSLKLYFSGKKVLLVKRFEMWKRVNSLRKVPSPWYKFYISLGEDIAWLKIWWNEFKFFVQEMIGPYKDFIVQKFFPEPVINTDIVGVKKIKIEVKKDISEESLEGLSELVKEYMRNSKEYVYEYELDLEQIEFFVDNDSEIERKWDKSFEVRREWYKKLFYFFREKIFDWFIRSYFYTTTKIYYFRFTNWFNNSNLKIILIWFFDKNILSKLFRVIIDFFVILFYSIVNLYIRFLIILFTGDKNFVLAKSIFFIIVKRFFIISKLNFKLSILHKINYFKLSYIYLWNWIYYFRVPTDYIILLVKVIYIFVKDLLILLYLSLKAFIFFYIMERWELGSFLMYYLIDIQFTFKLCLFKYENFYKKYITDFMFKKWNTFDIPIMKFEKKKFDGKKWLRLVLKERGNKNNRREWNDKWNKYINYIFRFFRIFIPFFSIYFLWAFCISFIIYLYKTHCIYTEFNDIIIIFNADCITFANNGVDNILYGIDKIILDNYSLSLDNYLAPLYFVKDCYINFFDVIIHYKTVFFGHRSKLITPLDNRYWEILANSHIHVTWFGKTVEIVAVPPHSAYMIIIREMYSTLSSSSLPPAAFIDVNGCPLYLTLINDLYFNYWEDLHFMYAHYGATVLNNLYDWNIKLFADIVKMDKRWHSHVIYPEFHWIVCFFLDLLVHLFFTMLKIILFLTKIFIIMSRFITVLIPQIILLVMTITVRLLFPIYFFLFALIHCPEFLTNVQFYTILWTHFLENADVVIYIFKAIIIPAFYMFLFKPLVVLVYFAKFIFTICYVNLISYFTFLISTVSVDEQYHPIINPHCLINIYWGNFPWDTVIFIKSFYWSNKFVFYVYPLMDFHNWYESFLGYLDILELSLGPKIIYFLKTLDIQYLEFINNSYVIFPFEQFDYVIVEMFIEATGIYGFIFSFREVVYYALAIIIYILFRILRFFIRFWGKSSGIIDEERIMYYKRKSKKQEKKSEKQEEKSEKNIVVKNEISKSDKKNRDK